MKDTIPKLYLMNLSLLTAHQIDSAYWREWELFGLPGGIQLFVGLNLVLIALFLFGFQKAITGTRTGLLYSLILALCGVFAFVFHGYYLLAGNEKFLEPVSMGVIGVGFGVSLVQGAVVSRRLTSSESV